MRKNITIRDSFLRKIVAYTMMNNKRN
jgi:hypothetical protein